MQTLTPTTTETNSNWTASAGNVEDCLADDDTSTFVTCGDASNELEVKFTTPSQTPGVGHSRFRLIAKGPGNIDWRFLEGSTELQTGTIYALASVYEERTAILTARPSAWTDLRLEAIASNGVVIYDAFLDVTEGSRDASDPKRTRGGKFFSRFRLWHAFKRN